MMNKELLAVAKGTKPADLVIQNGKIVNVYSGEIYEGGVAVCGDKIAAVGDVAYCIGEGTKVIDAGGNYLTPGFLDGHILPESSSLAIRPFAEAVLAHGTTGIMTDLHEVGVVSGLEGIESILKEAEATDLKIYFVVPSHVPFSPNLETSGGRFNPEIIRKASMEATAQMKNGERWDLIAALSAEPAFGMTEEEIKSHMEPSQYIGRCPEQVHAFTAKCRALCKNAESCAEEISL